MSRCAIADQDAVIAKKAVSCRLHHTLVGLCSVRLGIAKPGRRWSCRLRNEIGWLRDVASFTGNRLVYRRGGSRWGTPLGHDGGNPPAASAGHYKRRHTGCSPHQ